MASCGAERHEQTQITPVAHAPSTTTVAAGTSPLELGSRLFINRGFEWRDGLLHVPPGPASDPNEPAPLLVWLHGGGGSANDASVFFPLADVYGIVVLALDSRHNTWDGIDSPFGPDVRFIETALRHTMNRVRIDPRRLALGGLSDGASYALALGRSNGDVFTHIVAVSPWRLAPPAPPRGRPRIFVAHGDRDTVYPEWHSRRVIAPGLENAGYDVTYFTFDGPHWVTEAAAHAVMRWLLDEPLPGADEISSFDLR